jgi:hypothetical protein
MQYLKYPFPFFSTLFSLILCLSVTIANATEPLGNDVRGWTPTKRLIEHGNPAQLHLQMLPSPLRHLGDTMQIRITSPEAGHLFLLDINSAGQLTRIFPNQYSEPSVKRGFIKAGQTILIPDDNYGFDFTAIKPIGKGLLVAFLIEEEFVDSVSFPNEFQTINSSQAYSTLQNLHQHFNEMLETDESIAPIRWSIATLDYEIQD